MDMDGIMLLSIVNTKLRDCYESLEQLCEDLNESQEEIVSKLEAIGYTYNKDANQFIR